jgi:hypothetical protein
MPGSGQTPATGTTTAPRPALSFAETTPWELDWPDLLGTSGAQAVLKNGATRPDTVRLALMDFTAFPRNAPPIETLLALRDTVVIIPPASSRPVFLQAIATDPPAASYAGFIRARDTRATVFRAVHLETPTPVLDRMLGMTVRRMLPWEDDAALWHVDNVIPLAPGARVVKDVRATATAICSTPPAMLHRSDGRAALACVSTLPGDSAYRVLTLRVAHAGDYQGPLRMPGAAADDTISVTVRVTDFVAWPLLFVVLGLLLALASRYYFSVHRKDLALRRDVNLVAATWARARETFHQFAKRCAGDAGDRFPFSGLSIDRDFTAQIRELLRMIDLAPRSLFVAWDENNADYAALVARVKKLETAIGAWQNFATKCCTLSRAAASAEQCATRLPALPAIAGQPRVLAQAKGLLEPQELRIDELAQRTTAIEAAATFAREWRLRCERLARLYPAAAAVQPDQPSATRSADIAEPFNDGPCTPASVMRALKDVHNDLWQSGTEAALASREIDARLDGAQECLAQLSLAAESRRSSPSGRGRGIRDLSTGEDVSEETAMDAVKKYEGRTERIDWIFALLSLTVAVCGWLTQSYLGQAFGGPKAYIEAFIWGFGTNIGLEALFLLFGKVRAYTGGTAPA